MGTKLNDNVAFEADLLAARYLASGLGRKANAAALACVLAKANGVALVAGINTTLWDALSPLSWFGIVKSEELAGSSFLGQLGERTSRPCRMGFRFCMGRSDQPVRLGRVADRRYGRAGQTVAPER